MLDLQVAREVLGITRPELADKAGCSARMIEAIERGERHASPSMAQRCERALLLAAIEHIADVERAMLALKPLRPQFSGRSIDREICDRWCQGQLVPEITVQLSKSKRASYIWRIIKRHGFEDYFNTGPLPPEAPTEVPRLGFEDFKTGAPEAPTEVPRLSLHQFPGQPTNRSPICPPYGVNPRRPADVRPVDRSDLPQH